MDEVILHSKKNMHKSKKAKGETDNSHIFYKL
uniref:Uncharacterized protein n=1 Tax=Arundo donax TaxID=35708 RepID=A0A0A8YQ85_ARUDO